MKRIALTLIALFIICYSYSQIPQVDISIGSSFSGFTMGLNMKNLYNGFGMYLNSYGSGAYTGETNIDYSSIADRTTYDTRDIEINKHGISFGVTYNPHVSTENKADRLNFLFGVGYAVKQEVTTVYEYYIWDDFPSLNEGNLVTYISDSKTVPELQVLVGYDVYDSDFINVGIQAGLSTTHGLIGQIYLGWIVPMTSGSIY